jgi:hypothetical protein
MGASRGSVRLGCVGAFDDKALISSCPLIATPSHPLSDHKNAFNDFLLAEGSCRRIQIVFPARVVDVNHMADETRILRTLC